MKKLICVMLTAILVLSLFAGCGATADDGVYKIAIVQQLDHASLNEIRAAIEAELDRIAAEKGIQIEMKYSWAYGSTFSASPELQAMATGWYANGTEVIFCCGGTMFLSVAAAASAEDGAVVGVDVDQSFDSPTVITSAVKGLSDAAQWAIAKFYNGQWDEIGGVPNSLGAADHAVGLPTATWSLSQWSVEDYEAMFAKIAAGEVEISTEQLAVPGSTDNMTVIEVQ